MSEGLSETYSESPKKVKNHHKGEKCIVLTPPAAAAAEKERKTKKSERNKRETVKRVVGWAVSRSLSEFVYGIKQGALVFSSPQLWW